MNEDILEMKKIREGCPVLLIKIPKQIQKELDGWVNESRKFKDSPLADLKAHQNVGYLDMDGRNIIHISVLFLLI